LAVGTSRRVGREPRGQPATRETFGMPCLEAHGDPSPRDPSRRIALPVRQYRATKPDSRQSSSQIEARRIERDLRDAPVERRRFRSPAFPHHCLPKFNGTRGPSLWERLRDGWQFSYSGDFRLSPHLAAFVFALLIVGRSRDVVGLSRRGRLAQKIVELAN
jgi:hypothetical protein